MTLCVMDRKQCCCQPDEGVACPAGTAAQVQDKLNAELSSLKKQVAALSTQYLTLTDAMRYKEGEQGLSPEEYAEGLRKNAERYRWLRAQHWSTSPLCVVAAPKDSVKLGHCCPNGDYLDFEMDAVMVAGVTPASA